MTLFTRFFRLMAVGAWVLSSFAVQAQVIVDLRDRNADSTDHRSFFIHAEFRPRAEFRSGYRQLRTDTSIAAFYLTNRSRINLGYEAKNFIWYTSIQDIRTFGEDNPRATDGTIQVFETYVEPKLGKNLSLRIGRQKLVYDNQRLFAENDWRQNAGSHDGVRLRYKSQKLHTELFAAFNQPNTGNEPIFGTDFSPTGWTNYKILAVHFFNYAPNKTWAFTTINAADAYQDSKNREKLHTRLTSGGRVEFFKGNWYATFSGYYQYGENTSGGILAAYYAQPEIKFTTQKFTARLGFELMSGNDFTDSANTKDNSFVPLYGVAHRFMGAMDYFTNFPDDLHQAGLFNPYLFLIWAPNKKFQIRNDVHQFYSSGKLVETDGTKTDQYLGFEHDLLLSWFPNNYTKLDLGFSWMAPTKSMEAVKKGGNSERTPCWSYLMVTFKPELLKLLF